MACSLLGLTIAAGAAAGEPVKRSPYTILIGQTERHSELTKSVRIGQRAGASEETVMSLGSQYVVPGRPGGEMRVSGEVQVSVCLKSAPSGQRRECVGHVYGYDPKVTARLVVSAGQDDRGRDVRISRTETLRCKQRQPARNHHCVLTIPWQRFIVRDPAKLPCDVVNFDRDRCRVNLLVGASHPQAEKGDRLVIGAFDQDSRSVEGGKGHINAVNFFAGPPSVHKPLVTREPHAKSLPMGKKGTGRREVIYSIRVPKPDSTEVMVAARFRSRIGHLPYTAFTRTELIAAYSPKATRPEEMLHKLGTSPQVSPPNGFNCTHAASAFRDPCEVTKVGIVEVNGMNRKPLYINLVAAQSAQGGHERWRPGDKAKIPADGGFIKAWRL